MRAAVGETYVQISPVTALAKKLDREVSPANEPRADALSFLGIVFDTIAFEIPSVAAAYTPYKTKAQNINGIEVLMDIEM